MFYILFDVFVKSPAVALPCQPPFPLGFTANTDHQRARALQQDCGPQSGSMPPIGFQSWAVESAVRGVVDSESGLISRPFLVNCWCRTDLGAFQKQADSLYRAVTHHTHNTLHVLGSSYLDIACLLLLVRR
jgi:hypothetical protein